MYLMQVTCTSHVHTCTSHVHTCTSLVGHMYTRTSHVRHMYITCTSHVHHMYVTVHHMQVTCASHVGHMYITCRSHTKASMFCTFHLPCGFQCSELRNALTPGLSCQCSNTEIWQPPAPHNPGGTECFSGTPGSNLACGVHALLGDYWWLSVIIAQ